MEPEQDPDNEEATQRSDFVVVTLAAINAFVKVSVKMIGLVASPPSGYLMATLGIAYIVRTVRLDPADLAKDPTPYEIISALGTNTAPLVAALYISLMLNLLLAFILVYAVWRSRARLREQGGTESAAMDKFAEINGAIRANSEDEEASLDNLLETLHTCAPVGPIVRDSDDSSEELPDPNGLDESTENQENADNNG